VVTVHGGFGFTATTVVEPIKSTEL